MNILKKLLLIILIIYLLILTTGFPRLIDNHTPNIKDTQLMTNSRNLTVITKQIMTKYFDEFKKMAVSNELRIEDFKIISISGITGNRDKFWYTMKYTLKPINMKTFRMFGMWSYKGSWIINRYAYGWIIRTGNVYRIDSMNLGSQPW
jgi:hypothetical protein